MSSDDVDWLAKLSLAIEELESGIGEETADDESRSSESPSLGSRFGLSEDEIACARSVFIEFMKDYSIDAGAIFDSIARGHSLAEALALPDGTCDFLYASAYRWLSIGNYNKAEPLFRILCLISGGESDYWIGYALCLREHRIWDGVEQCLSIAESISPERAVSHFYRVESLILQEKWEEAKSAFETFEKHINSNSPGGGLSKAMLYEAERMRTALSMRNLISPFPTTSEE